MQKTAANIQNELLKSLSEHETSQILKENVTFVTDRGANIKKALEDFSWIPCCCHILNTVLFHTFRLNVDGYSEIEDTVNSNSAENLSEDNAAGMITVSKLLTYVKDLVTFLKRSGLASKLKTTVIQQCEIRDWLC